MEKAVHTCATGEGAPLRVMIVAGESSGELYGAYLARALRSRHPEVLIKGVGGDRMASSGVDLVARVSGSLGIIELLKTYREVRRTFTKVRATLRTFRPHVVIPIDFPDFNIRVAAEAKAQGIPVLYYVSPQVWAWRKRRIRQFGRVADRMAVLLPFEEEMYRNENVQCSFVGHPVMDEIREVLEGRGLVPDDIGSPDCVRAMRRSLGLDPDARTIAIMPGSRYHEVQRLLPVLAEAVTVVHDRYPGTRFVLPVAPNLDNSLVRGLDLHRSCLVLRGRSVEALLSADCAVIASGTSTLQACLLRVPMVVVYRLSPLTFLIGRLLVKVNYISLVNILREKCIDPGAGPLVRELLQEDVNRETVVAEVSRILDDESYREAMRGGFGQIARFFLDRHASAEVAAMAESLCAGRLVRP